MKTKKINITRAGLVGLVMMMLAGLVSAAFTVQSFSCNSQSGTIIIENGGTLDCQATIKNAGSGTANMTTVQLILDGTWAEATTYTGLGFTTSVSAGATTTATFGNIKPTTPGLHGFNYVRIDSVTDSYPSATTVNVLAVRNLVLTTPANASQGSEFTVSASATAGGNEDISLVISPACSLASGETSSKSLGTVPDNTVSSASWRLVQGSSSCSFNVTATGSSGSVTVTKTKSDSVSYLPSDAPVVNVTLNEFMANPSAGQLEWIEIYNAGNIAVNLSGWSIDDEVGGSSPYSLPAESISVGGFKVYYGNDTSIDLNESRDSVRLLNSTGVADNYSWTSLIPENTSMMRSIDGAGSWAQSSTSTPGSSNAQVSSISLVLGWNLISLPVTPS